MAADGTPTASRSPARDPGSRTRAFQVLLLGLLPAVVVLFLVYMRYVERSRQYLVTRSYRALATAGREVEARLVGLNAEIDTQLAKAKSAVIVDGKAEPIPCKTLPARPRCGKPKEPACSPVFVGTADGGPWIFVKHPNPRSGCWRMRLDEAIPGSALAMFDDVVLAEATPEGGVFWHRNDEAGAARELGTMVRRAKLVPPTQGTTVLSRLLFTPDPSATRFGWRGAFTVPVLVSHLAQRRLLFCQPIRVPLDGPGWAVCGLRQSERLANDAAKIPFLLLAMGLCVAAGTAVAWPALKLRFLGPRERLTLGDVRGLVFSCLGGIGLVTFILGSLYAHQHLRAALDDESAAIATRFDDNLTHSVCTAAQQLDGFGAVLRDSSGALCPVLDRRSLKSFRIIAVTDAAGTVRRACAPKDGKVVEAARPSRPVNDRQYFKDATAAEPGRHWLLDCDGRPTRVAVQSIRTATAGETTIAVARRVETGPFSGGVMVAVTRPPEVMAPILPLGLGFAVLDPGGRVMLHSDESRNLEENFIEESDDDHRLVAAIGARRAVQVDVPYYGHPHRVVLQPLTNTPWSIAIFRETEPETTLTALTSITWLTTFGAYYLALLIVVAVIGTFRPGYRALWLWPDPKTGWAYVVLSGFLLVVASACLATLRHQGGLADVRVLIGAPVVALAGVYVVMTIRRARTESNWRLPWVIGVVVLALGGSLVLAGLHGRLGRLPFVLPALALGMLVLAAAMTLAARRNCPEIRLRRSFVGLLVLLLLVVGAWPAALLFRDAREQAVEGFVKRAQLDYASAVLAHPGGSRYTSRLVGVPDPAAGATTKCAFESAPDRTDPLSAAVYRMMCQAQPDARCREFVPELRRHVSTPGFVGLTSYADGSRVRLMGFGRASDDAWCWGWDASNPPRLVMRVKSGGTGNGMHLAAAVPIPQLPTHALGILALVALGTAASILLAVLVRFAITRLFLLPAPGSAGTGRRMAGTGEPGLRLWVFIHPQQVNPATILDETDAELFDLLEYTDPRECAKIALPEGETRKAIVVDHLEARLTPDWSEKLLPRLEKLVFDGTLPVALVSDIDPIAFLADQFTVSEPTDPEARKVVDRFWRWVRLLAACDRNVTLPWPAEKATPGVLSEAIARRATPAVSPIGRAEEARYWRIWGQSTKHEKLAMRQLAHEGFLNPNSPDVADRLIERGLVRCTPAFAFFNDDFRDFVLRAEPLDDILRWEREGSASWRRIQVPLLASVALVVGFFFLTQPQMYNMGLGVLTALTTAVPLVLRVSGLIAQRGQPTAT